MMARDVVTVRDTQTVSAAAALLSDHDITGAPVVDETGKVAGVVSQSDIVRAVSAVPPGIYSGPEELGENSFFSGPNGDLYPGMPMFALGAEDPVGSRPVSEIMMPARFCVRPETSLAGLARYLVTARVHRALVMEDGELLGIVTSFDVLRAIADSDVTDAPI